MCYRYANLCRPCEEDKECEVAYLNETGKCIEYGAEGSFCGIECNEDVDCPEGYVCQEEGGTKQCVPEDGKCECTEKFKERGYKTRCYKENEYGKCWGERTCDSECDAKEPAQETCNGQDDDCDGDTDEGLTDLPCENSNEYGTCKGTGECVAGKVVNCNAPVPAPD